MTAPKVALAPFLRSCPEVITLGIRATIDDYSTRERKLLRSAERVFFPTPHFAYLFHALRIPAFPNYHTYRLQRSRVLQHIMLAYAQIPRPVTRIYFGKKQKAMIAGAFSFPLVAMGPLTALHPRHLVDHPAALEAYCQAFNPLLIQEAVEWDTTLRILWVHTDCVGILRRTGSRGPDASFEPVSSHHPEFQTVVAMTRAFAREANLHDMVMDWGHARGQWQMVEMRRPPACWPLPERILHRHQHISELVKTGQL